MTGSAESPTPTEKRARKKHWTARWAMAASWLAVVATLVSLFADLNWIADVATQLRVQYAFILLIGVAVACAQKRWKPFGLMLACLLFNSWPLATHLVRTPELEQPHQSRSESTYRLMMLNVLRTNQDVERILNYIDEKDPDFVFLMEVHPFWRGELETNIEAYPYQKIIDRSDYAGIAFLSKHEWSEIEVFESRDLKHPAIEVNFPSVENEFDEVQSFRIIATHPIPPFGARMTRERDLQIVDAIARVDPTIANLVIGDFNQAPWSPKFRRAVEEGGLIDCSRGLSIAPTLTPIPTVLGGIKVDHILATPNVETGHFGFDVGSNVGSDHRPVIFDFSIRNSK